MAWERVLSARARTGTEVERDEHGEMGREYSRKCISRMPRSFRELKSVGKNAAGQSTKCPGREEGGGRVGRKGEKARTYFLSVPRSRHRRRHVFFHAFYIRKLNIPLLIHVVPS